VFDMNNRDPNFYEVVGMLTVLTLLISLMIWVGWIIILFLLWCWSVWGIFYLTYYSMLKEKYLKDFYLLLFPVMISASIFWFGVSDFSDIVKHSFKETLMWYSIIVFSLSALLVKLFIRK